MGKVVIVIVEYDTDADATYFTLSDHPVVRTVEVDDAAFVDIDASGEPVGVEVLAAPTRLPDGLADRLVETWPSLKPLFA